MQDQWPAFVLVTFQRLDDLQLLGQVGATAVHRVD